MCAIAQPLQPRWLCFGHRVVIGEHSVDIALHRTSHARPSSDVGLPVRGDAAGIDWPPAMVRSLNPLPSLELPRFQEGNLVMINTASAARVSYCPGYRSRVSRRSMQPTWRNLVPKRITQKTETTDTRKLSAEEIDCVVGGVMMSPDGRSCTERKMPRPFGLRREDLY